MHLMFRVAYEGWRTQRPRGDRHNWKRNNNGTITRKKSKKVLEILVVKPDKAENWALPGGILGPNETIPLQLQELLKKEFWGEAQNPQDRGTEVFKGYLDDPRNTDNAWIETSAVNVHLESQDEVDDLTNNIIQKKCTISSNWQMMDQKIPLFANENEILQKVAVKFQSHF